MPPTATNPLVVKILFMIILLAGCGNSGPSRAAGSVAESAMASAVDLRIAGCRTEPVRGAGSMIANPIIDGPGGDGYILTAAHVVAGAESVMVRPAGGDREAVEAVLVAIDPINDLALLDSDLALPPLPLADLASGDEGVVVLFDDEVARVQPFRIVNPVIVNILDIYGTSTISRAGYRVAIEIDPGDSGAMLVGRGGAGGGVLYAKSRGAAGHAFATDTSAVAALLSAAAGADPVEGIGTGACP